jgi:hypothetical protein
MSVAGQRTSEPAATPRERDAQRLQSAPGVTEAPAAMILGLQRHAGNRAVASLVASGGGTLARQTVTAPGTRAVTVTTQTIVDSNIAIALDRGARGQALTPGHQVSIDQIQPIAADQARGVVVTPQTVTEMGAGGGAGATLNVIQEVHVSAGQRTAIYDAFRAAGARPADAEVATSAALAQTAHGATPRLALADRQLINGLARMGGVDPQRYGQYQNLAEYLLHTRGTNVMTITVEGRQLEIQPVQPIRPNLPPPRGGGAPPPRPPVGGGPPTPPRGGPPATPAPPAPTPPASTPPPATPPKGGPAAKPSPPAPSPPVSTPVPATPPKLGPAAEPAPPAPSPRVSTPATPTPAAKPPTARIDLAELKMNLRGAGRAAALSLVTIIVGYFLSKYTEKAIQSLIDSQVKQLEPDIGARVTKAVEEDMARGWLHTNPNADVYVYITLDVWRTGTFEAEMLNYFWDVPVVSIYSVIVSPLVWSEGAWKTKDYPSKWEGNFERTGPGIMIEHNLFTSRHPLKSLITGPTQAPPG